MLGIKWLIFLFLFVAVCGLLSGLISGTMGQEPPWQGLTSTFEEVHSIGGFFYNIPALAGGITSTIWNMFTWNYTFLDGSPWVYIKWFFFFPISAAFALALVITLVSMIVNAVSTVVP